MGYLNDLLSKNPLVIDGYTIRPHHKYTDDLYTGGVKMAMDKNIKLTINGKSKPKQTNYDRIKSMSIDEIAVFMVECGHDFPPYCDCKKVENCDQNCLSCAKQWLSQKV